MESLGPAIPFADVNGFGQVDYSEMNKGVTPIFYMEPVPDGKASEEAGAPRFREIEMVRIVVAGDMLNIASSPVTEELKERFADQYDRWKAKHAERIVDGTPLREWPALSRTQIMELEAIHIETVEALAAVSDQNVNRIMDGRILRAKADAFLKAAKDGAHTAKLAAENERLRGDMDELRRQFDELSARFAAEKPGKKAS